MLIDMDVAKLYRCSKCTQGFDFKFQVDNHFRRAHENVYAAELFHAIVEPEQFRCLCCNLKFYYGWDLYQHCKQHHSRTDACNIELAPLCDEENDNFPCDFCEFKSDSSLSLIRHTASCEGVPRTPTAEDDNLLLPTALLEGLEGDVTAQHSNAADYVCILTQAKNFQCANCSYGTQHEADLKGHMLKHAARYEIQWFTCTRCPHKTKWKSNLKTHMLTHATNEEIEWFKCAKCSYKTRYKSSLKKHMLRHATDGEIDWFECAKCSYKAKRKGTLKTHMLQHAIKEEIVWFKCSKCSYESKIKSNLRKHMLTHDTNEEIVWFKCAKCPYKVKTKSDLKKHMLTHATNEEIDWFKCFKCSYKAKRKDTLKEHMLQHARSEDIDWFKCVKCSYKAKRKRSLRIHNMSQHATSELIDGSSTPNVH